MPKTRKRTVMVAKALKIILEDGPCRGLRLNVGKTELFWPSIDPRSKVAGLFPDGIARLERGVKLLGGPVSTDVGFCRDLSLHRVRKSVELTEAVNQLEDPQCELLLLRSCAGVAKLYFALRTCSPFVFDEAQVQFDKGLRVALEKTIVSAGPGFGPWQWRLATLPVKLGRLGIYAAGDAVFFSFLASRLQTLVLQNRILSKTKIENMGNAFSFALEKFCSHVLASPESLVSDNAVPHQQTRLAALYFDSLKKGLAQEFDLSTRQMVLWQSAQTPHSQDYLFAIPIEGLGQRMNARSFRATVCYRLGIAIFSSGELTVSLACNQLKLDAFGDHATMCPNGIGVKWRHDFLRDGLADQFRRVGVGVRTEVALGFLSNTGGQLKSADLLLHCWEAGDDCCVDVTITSPFAGGGAEAYKVSKTVEAAVTKKKRKYDDKCRLHGHRFLAFAVTSLGEFALDSLDVLKRLVGVASGTAMGSKEARFIYAGISFMLHKGLGAQLVARLPASFL